MLTKKQKAELEIVEQWMATANSNTLLSFKHMADNIALKNKFSREQGMIHAYKKMKRREML